MRPPLQHVQAVCWCSVATAHGPLTALPKGPAVQRQRGQRLAGPRPGLQRRHPAPQPRPSNRWRRRILRLVVRHHRPRLRARPHALLHRKGVAAAPGLRQRPWWPGGSRAGTMAGRRRQRHWSRQRRPGCGRTRQHVAIPSRSEVGRRSPMAGYDVPYSTHAKAHVPTALMMTSNAARCSFIHRLAMHGSATHPSSVQQRLGSRPTNGQRASSGSGLKRLSGCAEILRNTSKRMPLDSYTRAGQAHIQRGVNSTSAVATFPMLTGSGALLPRGVAVPRGQGDGLRAAPGAPPLVDMASSTLGERLVSCCAQRDSTACGLARTAPTATTSGAHKVSTYTSKGTQYFRRKWALGPNPVP